MPGWPGWTGEVRTSQAEAGRALRDLQHEPWAIGTVNSAYEELPIRACRALGGFEPVCDVSGASTPHR